jgi:SAM-dependent methyltransferase
MDPNAYSPTWFELFLRNLPLKQTQREVEFLARHLPLPEFRSVLDICCGEGRHAAKMSPLGYAITGVDRDEAAIAHARANAPAARFIIADMRELLTLGSSVDAPLDAALCLWQSFGYFDAETNAAVLRDIAALLRPGGRLVLDLYHPGFFEARSGERDFEVRGKQFTERRYLATGRLRVELETDKATVDIFDWQIYSPEGLIAFAAQFGLSLVIACSGFDEMIRPTGETARYQLVLQRD